MNTIDINEDGNVGIGDTKMKTQEEIAVEMMKITLEALRDWAGGGASVTQESLEEIHSICSKAVDRYAEANQQNGDTK